MRCKVDGIEYQISKIGCARDGIVIDISRHFLVWRLEFGNPEWYWVMDGRRVHVEFDSTTKRRLLHIAKQNNYCRRWLHISKTTNDKEN